MSLRETTAANGERTLKKKAFSVLAAVTSILLLSVTVALAAPKVEVKIKAAKEKVVVSSGKKVKRLVAVEKTVPGDVIHYFILYRNVGNEAATNAILTDPIPKGTVYVSGSASNTENVTFSIDGGKTFDRPTLLTYQVKGINGQVEMKNAAPDQYTNIRWTITKIPAGATGRVSFQVRVK